MERKYFIVVTGLPGSGKTTLAEQIKRGVLWEQRSAHVDFLNHYNIAVHEGRIAVVDDPEAMAEIDAAAQDNKFIVIVDPNLGKRGKLDGLASQLSAKYRSCDIQAVIFNPSLGVCQENCRRRAWEGGHYISERELQGFNDRFDPDHPPGVTIHKLPPYQKPWSHETMPALLMHEKIKALGVELESIPELKENHYHQPHFIKVEWTRYTEDAGNYNGPGEGTIPGDSEPDLTSFDNLLYRLAPTMNSYRRQELKSKLVHTKDWESTSDYYGNYTAYSVKYANLNEVALYLLKEGHFPEAQKLIDEAKLNLRIDAPTEAMTSDIDLV